ncbi:uncharacterized protein [Clytia hemisphaerica]|uniref:uncharacterized protein n=1 Tax=Clytia hemisphaerica TaxID=252671 RepID=UPI0034D431FF|eukprot:TCONS_00021714-protein
MSGKDVMVGCVNVMCGFHKGKCHKLEDLLSHSFRCGNLELCAKMDESKYNSAISKCGDAERSLDTTRLKVEDAEKEISQFEKESKELNAKIEITRRFNNEVIELEDRNLTPNALPREMNVEEKEGTRNNDRIRTDLLNLIRAKSIPEFYTTLSKTSHLLTISQIKELQTCAVQENNPAILTYLLTKHNLEIIEADYIRLFTKALRMYKNKPTEISPCIPVLLKFHPKLLVTRLPEMKNGTAFHCALSDGNFTLFNYLLNYKEETDLKNFDVSTFENLHGDEKKMVKKLVKDKRKLQGDGGGFLEKLGL